MGAPVNHKAPNSDTLIHHEDIPDIDSDLAFSLGVIGPKGPRALLGLKYSRNLSFLVVDHDTYPDLARYGPIAVIIIFGIAHGFHS